MLPTPWKPSSRRARAASSERFPCGGCGTPRRPAPAGLFPLDNRRYNDYSCTMNLRSRPAVSLENRIFVALLQTAATLGQEAEHLLNTAGITTPQTTTPPTLPPADPARLACPATHAPQLSPHPSLTPPPP